MDPLSSHEEVEIPMPINSAYVGLLHNHHHHHEPSLDITPPASNNAPTNSREDRRQHQQSQGYHENYTDDDHPKRRVIVRYRECLKNHAATMGGNATDGCGEFMPSGPHEGGEGGGLRNLICSACNCHRNFHRKEIEGEQQQQQQQQQVVPHSSTTNTYPQFYPSTPHPVLLGGPRGRGVIFGTRPAATHHVDGVVPFSRTVPISMAYPASDDHSHDHHRLVRKRFRTKFSPEQKEKMMEFAERVGWKIQRQEESVVQQFCQEIGVKRRVLKVWMHNNKHNLPNKIINHNHDNNNSNDNHDNNNNNHSSSSM